MTKIWLNEYPKHVAQDIDPNRYDSIISMFNSSCKRFANKTMYKNMGISLSYKEINQLSHDFAAYLQQELGLKKGDRFAIMLPNTLQYPIALFGAMKAGLAIVNVNPLYTARELKHQLNDAQCESIIILENFAHSLSACIDETPIKNVITTELGDLFPPVKRLLVNSVVKYVKKMVPKFSFTQAISIRQLLKKGQQHIYKPVTISHDDIAFLQYTGGTTGVSKAAVLTQRNIIANILQAKEWVNLKEGEEIVVTALPLYHIFALTANCFMFMCIGGSNLLITNPRDIPTFIKTLKKERFTALTGVNTLFNALVKHPDFSTVNFNSLKLSLGGGMAVQKAVASEWKSVTGSTLIEAYGLTETSPAVCINPIHLKAYNGAIGLPISSTHVCIMTEDETPCKTGDIGELCIKGPQVMKEYWHNKEATKQVFTKDHWLKTGDLAYMDEKGYVYLTSRKKDMIIVSGFNVYPNEIEDIVTTHSGILECAAIGVSDKKSGERIKLFVVKSDPNLSSDAIHDFCKQNLTNYKRPTEIEFRDSLPKTNVGKILHRELRN